MKAAADFLDRVPPDIILFESNRDPEPLVERELVKLLFARGYRIFGFEPGLFSVRLIEQEARAPSIAESNDYVALRNGPRLQQDLRRLGIAGG